MLNADLKMFNIKNYFKYAFGKIFIMHFKKCSTCIKAMLRVYKKMYNVY